MLNALTGDVARNRRIFTLAGNLIEFIKIDDAALGAFNVAIGSLQKLKNHIFNVFAHVARFGQRRSIGNGKGHIKHLGQSLRKKRFAGARGADEQNVAFGQFHVCGFICQMFQTLIVVVNRYRQDAFGSVLTDHVLIESIKNFLRFRKRLILESVFGGLTVCSLSRRLSCHRLQRHASAIRTNAHAVGAHHVFNFTFCAPAKGAAFLLIRH